MKSYDSIADLLWYSVTHPFDFNPLDLDVSTRVFVVVGMVAVYLVFHLLISSWVGADNRRKQEAATRPSAPGALVPSPVDCKRIAFKKNFANHPPAVIRPKLSDALFMAGDSAHLAARVTEKIGQKYMGSDVDHVEIELTLSDAWPGKILQEVIEQTGVDSIEEEDTLYVYGLLLNSIFRNTNYSASVGGMSYSGYPSFTITWK